MIGERIETLFVHRDASDAPLVQAVASATGCTPIFVEEAADVYRWVLQSAHPIDTGKRTLFLTENQGAFIRECPGTRHYRCCGYQILHIGTYCTMDCAYCILQTFFHPPVLQWFVNHERLFQDLDKALASRRFMRIGTGEYTDSLIWEPITDLNRRLIDRFSKQNDCVIELKTKTTAIGRLKGLQHNRKTILSWSLNTERMIVENERYTAALEARLRAAADAQDHGYPLAFHFDPIVLYNKAETEYAEVIDRLFRHVDPADVVWISLGSFRFPPDLKTVIQRRFPDSALVYGEFVPGKDAKMRYFQPLRIELYRRIVDRIRRYAPDIRVYFCMEDEKVWETVLGVVPEAEGGLAGMLDEAAVRVCGLNAKETPASDTSVLER